MRHKVLFVAARLVLFRPRARRLAASLAASWFAAAGLAACAPQLGDGCTTDTQCSATGDRFCDRSQPGGYCTILNCEPKSCGSEGVCVRFKPDQPRLSSNWCMEKCSTTGDCNRDAYVCRSADQLGLVSESSGTSEDSMLMRAEVLDSDPNQKFCVVKE